MPTSNLTAVFDDNGNLNEFLAPTVYTRTAWSEEWVEAPYLRCNSATWTIQPGTSQAELQWNYGPVQMFDIRVWETLLPDDGSRRYVKIVFPNDLYVIGGEIQPITWYGMVFGVGTAQGGVAQSIFDGSDYETGAQTIQCVGLEKLLEDTVVRTSQWTDDDGNLFRIDRGLTFNDYRADGTIGGNMSGEGRRYEGIPCFSNRVIDDDAFWSSRDILKYLIGFHMPSDRDGVPMPIELNGLETYFVTRDRPHLPTHGRNVRDLITQLLSRERFVTWTLEFDEFDNIYIKLIQLNGDTLVLPSNDVLDANPRRWHFSIDEARGASALTLSHADAVERVRVQGARATSTFTISYADDTLEEGYTSTQKTSYDAGGESKPGYAGGTNAFKRKLNKWARARDDMKFVYSRFKIPDDWDGIAKNGEGSGGNLFYAPITTETPEFKFCPRELELEPYTAMRDGYNYETLGGTTDTPTPPVKSGDGPFNHRPPLVLIKWPAEGMDASALATSRWLFIDQVGQMADEDSGPNDPETSWSGHVDIPRKDRAIVVKVTGEEQFVIAGDDYELREEERLRYLWDWKTIVATVTAKWDAFCEGAWPQNKAELPPNDHIREVLFDAGDEYRLDWLVPQTVIGIDTATGGLNRSALGGWMQNDRSKLVDRARLAFAWYGVERRAIQLTTSRINGSIKPGDYVVETGSIKNHTVNTVVTSIRIDCGPGPVGGSPPQPVQTYVTDWIPDLDMFLSPNLAPSLKPVAAPSKRTWEAEKPKGPEPTPQPGDAYGSIDAATLNARHAMFTGGR